MDEQSSDAPRPTRLKVECDSGYRGEGTPRCFFLHERRFDVQETLDCWLGPGHRYFKVQVNDGDVYILRHDTVHDRWELTMFASKEYLVGGDSSL